MTDKTKRPQRDAILVYMAAGNRITSMEALKRFGCFRLGARIWDLKHAGYPIGSQMVTDAETGKRFTEYWLMKEQA